MIRLTMTGLAALALASAPANAATILRHDSASSLRSVIDGSIRETFDDSVLAPGLAVFGNAKIVDGHVENSAYGSSRKSAYAFADGVFGFGGDIAISSISNTNALHVTATLADATVVSIADLTGNSARFFGFSSDTAIKSVTFSSLRGGEIYWRFDNLLAGQGAVPEPSTWISMVLAFGIIGGIMRKRRDLEDAHVRA
jgi:hypothetical protein